MLRWTLLLTIALFLASLSFAQSREEDRLNERQAKTLHTYAEDAYKAGFPKIARRVWLMLLSEYDPNHAGARKALGYEKLGDSWAVSSSFVYPKDDNPDPRKAAQLQKDWESAADKLAREHLKIAEQYGKAGRTDMAQRHYEKVIFFSPRNAEAQAALEHKPVAGLTGTDIEQVLYDRSKKIERAVAEEARKDYPVERLPADDKHPFLENARIPYTSVRSEHFTVRGDFEPELLMEAARYGERAIRVMQVLTEGYTGFSTDPARWVREWAFFQDGDTYKQVLMANAELMDAAALKFRVEQTRGSVLVGERLALQLSAPQNEQGVYDGAVRNVAQSHSGFRSPGLREGIGHTVVGMMFNNNRQFIVDREEQLRTTTGEEDVDRYSPNMDTWKDLALEAAWKLGDGMPAARLPLLDAAKFTDDARIKAWSFCDYVVRRDPTLLTSLDRLADEKHPIEVDKKFTEQNDGLSVAQLEKEWKDFWTEATPVLRAIRNNTEPLTAVSRDVKKWLSAFNEARKEQRQTEVTWSADFSGRCREHTDYLIANPSLRGAVHEQTQDINAPGGSHLGAMFAEMAAVETNADKPKDVFKRWLDFPGYRDTILNSRLRTIGLYSEGSVLVMDVIRGVGRPPEGKGGHQVYPGGSRVAVPNSVRVADLGPELRAQLERLGRGNLEVVGYPITLHQFGNGGLMGNRESYRCRVTIMGTEVEGFVHVADGGANRRTSAPGMVVFYPFAPLRRGVEVEAVWTFEHETGTTRIPTKFNT
jgi:hypothetical protein